MIQNDVGRGLLFGALALQSMRVDENVLSRAFSDWLALRHAGRSLADVLVACGALDLRARAQIEAQVDARLHDFGGDARAALSALASASLRRSLSALPSDELRHILDDAARVQAPLARSLHGSMERYALDHLHAKGGLGQVWLARDLDLDRDVALKEIRPEHAADPRRWERFVQEARLTGRLDHPGVVPIYEVARKPDGEQPFYTMRFVRGRTLAQAVREHAEKRRRGAGDGVELQALLSAFVAVCNTIAFAHSRGVIHRDLKGDNVILGDFGEVIVLDWGIAKALGEPDQSGAGSRLEEDSALRTEEGDVIGTPAFMSPEQAAGRVAEVDASSDVYGLGAVLYEILTGQAPFAGSNVMEVLERVRNSPPPAPRTLAPGTRAELEAICLKALQKSKSARYPSAVELARDVQRFLADEPVSACPEPFSKRAGRFVRKHRTLVTSAAVLLVSAVIALAVGLELLAGKQKQVEAARARAEKNFGLARGAVDKYLMRVADNAKLKEHGLEPLDQRSADTDLERDLAGALINLGLIDRQLVETAKAEQSYVRALELYDGILEREPASTQAMLDYLIACTDLALLYSETSRAGEAEALTRKGIGKAAALAAAAQDEACQAQVASLEDNLGTLYIRLGRREESEHAHEAGLAIRRKLAAAQPQDLERRNALVMSLNNLVTLYGTGGRPAQAKPLVQEAAELVEASVRENPGNPEYENNLGATYNNLAGIETLLGQLDEARQTHLKVLALRGKLVREHPVVLDYSIELAGSYCNLGELDVRAAEPARGLEQLDQAVAALEGVLAKEPKHTIALYYLSYCESWRARALDALGRHAEALQRWDRSIALDTRNDPALRAGKSVALAHAGSVDAAVELADQTAKAEIPAAEDVLALARAYALASGLASSDAARAEELGARAVRSLERAAKAGYFAAPETIDAAERDPDLAALRERADFRGLLERLRRAP